MSVPQNRLPSQMSPMAAGGVSIDPSNGYVTATGGVMSNIDDYLRPKNKAKKMRNFHQFTRGCFSSGGGGWARDLASGLNAGAAFLDFGTYVDALGTKFLLAQVADKLYSYDIVAHAGTAVVTGLNSTALPCMRRAAPTLGITANPFTIYCNGKQEPIKIYNATAGNAPNTSATLGFTNGFLTETATIGGTITAGDKINISLTSTILTVSPTVVTYTVVAGDATTTIAGALATALNALATLSVAGLSATSAAAVITISYPQNAVVTFAQSVTGAATETVTLAAGPATPVFPGTFNGLRYTKPALCTPFASRMAYTGFANTGTSGNAVACQVLISSLGNAETFAQSTPTRATDAWSVPIPPELGLPTAITFFRPLTNVASEILVIGCQNGMAVVTGTDATSFNIQIQSDEFGIPSNRTFIKLDNMLAFLATDGFRVYTGQNTIQNLIPDTFTLDIYDEFLKIDRTKWQAAHAVHHRDTQEVWFWVPYTGDAGLCKHAFVFQYNTIDGQPIWYFIDNTICQASIEFNSTFYGGNDVGLVQKWYGVNNYDDASAGGAAQNIIPGSELILSYIGVGNPAQFCSVEHTVVGGGVNNQPNAPTYQKFLITAAACEKMDDGSTRMQQQQPINFLLQSTSKPQTALDTWVIGTAAFPSNDPKFLDDFVSIGHGRFWQMSLVCNDSSHNLDFTFLSTTLSVGGQRV